MIYLAVNTKHALNIDSVGTWSTFTSDEHVRAILATIVACVMSMHGQFKAWTTEHVRRKVDSWYLSKITWRAPPLIDGGQGGCERLDQVIGHEITVDCEFRGLLWLVCQGPHRQHGGSNTPTASTCLLPFLLRWCLLQHWIHI